jgi:hypothetical protein
MDLLIKELNVFESTVIPITAASFLEKFTDRHDEDEFVKEKGRKNKLGRAFFTL